MLRFDGTIKGDDMFEVVSNIYGITVNILGIIACLFCYIAKPRKVWVYALSFLLLCLLSNYYWGIYVLVMGGEYPNVSSTFAYFGWNMAFLVLPVMQIHVMSKEERRFFHPVALIPIPLNIFQFTLYIPFGGIFNSVWQGLFATISACLSLSAIMYYVKNKKNGAKPPWISYACIGFVILEYVMWTSSCYDWPSEWLYPYNYACVLDFAFYLVIPKMIMKAYGDTLRFDDSNAQSRLKRTFMPIYTSFVIFCCVSGAFLAFWMRKTLALGVVEGGNADPYSVIAVMLFVISVIILSVTISVIFVVRFNQKSAESAALMEAKAVAEHSNAAKSDFLANMSHEIRTPINAVLGMNEMILRESLKARDDLPEDRDVIIDTFSEICNNSGNIDSAGKNLLALINDILDFSKIEAGKLELVESDYKFSAVLNDVSNMITFKTKTKKLRFDITVNKSMPDKLEGDEIRIRQIITNLLNNAVKYTNEGRIVLSVDYEMHDDDSLDLLISVKDTGIGIKEEDISKLFDKFERVDLKKNSTVEGTGLGLAITESLIDMMNGKIEVKSVYGKGSTFSIVIPQKIVSKEEIGDYKKKYRKSISSMSAKEQKFFAPDANILVVDDTKMNLLVVKGLLKNSGINIETAESGAASIELAAQNKYDVIFMDQRMPEMDGITAMSKIKEDESGINRDTPFICLTADALSGAKEKYIAEGFTDYLSKPVDMHTLERILIEYLPADKVKSGSSNN